MTVGFGSASTAELEDHLGIPGAIPQKRVSFRKNSVKSMSQSVRSATSAQAQLAVFLSCQELKFVATDISTYKQIVTIYNPYDFDIRYQAFCTTLNRYELTPGSGRVTAQSSIDITVRLRDPSSPGPDANDNFRFRISELSNRDNILGERELRVSFAENGSVHSEKSHVRGTCFRPQKPPPILRPSEVGQTNDAEPQPSIFIIIIGMFSLLGLCLPTSGDRSESWAAQYVTLTMNQKLIAAFVLGMVTMVVFRTR